jgi:hypothetical protein
MKNLVIIFVAVLLFSEFAMADSPKVFKCRTKGCNNINKVDLTCYGENNKAVQNLFNAATIKIVGLDIYSEPLNDGHIKRSLLLGPHLVRELKKIRPTSFLKVCNGIENFCNDNGISVQDDGDCKLVRMTFYITADEKICDATDITKSNCL